MNQYKIMLVDDEPDILDLLEKALNIEGFENITKIDNGLLAVSTCRTFKPDMIILDVMLPDIDGYEVCKQIREFSHCPIIFLSSKNDELDKILGLAVGGDDYVTKPFTTMELLARVNSHLRRYGKYLEVVDERKSNDKVYVIGGLELNEETIEVFVDGSPVKLTPLEFKILLLLMKNPGRVFSAEEIYERVWNEQAINTDTIMVHIRKIREKIEINPREPKYLKVVWGIGYKMEKH